MAAFSTVTPIAASLVDVKPPTTQPTSVTGVNAPTPMPEAEHYIALEDFAIPYNGGLLNYATGDVITSSYLVKYFLKEKAPIGLSGKAGKPICCPHCQKSFFQK